MVRLVIARAESPAGGVDGEDAVDGVAKVVDGAKRSKCLAAELHKMFLIWVPSKALNGGGRPKVFHWLLRHAELHQRQACTLM